MKPLSFEEIVMRIYDADGRYDPEAYYYLRDVIDRTTQKLGRSGPKASDHHVTGQELSQGFQECLLEDFGPMAATLAESWGVVESADIGSLVYNLIEGGAFSKSPQDKKSDFDGLFNLIQQLEAPYRPKDVEGFKKARKKRMVAEERPVTRKANPKGKNLRKE